MEDLCDFEANHDYTESSSTAMAAIQRNPVLKNQIEKQNKKVYS